MPREKTSKHIQARLNRSNPIEAVAIQNYEDALTSGGYRSPRQVLADALYRLNPVRVDSDAERIAALTAEAVSARIESQLREQARELLDAIHALGYRVVAPSGEGEGGSDGDNVLEDDDALSQLLDSMARRMGGGGA